jgi:hypothetical protein
MLDVLVGLLFVMVLTGLIGWRAVLMLFACAFIVAVALLAFEGQRH